MQNLMFVALPPKNRKSLDMPTLPFLHIFSWAFVLAKFEVRSFTHSRDNSDCSFGWCANPNLGKAEAVGGRGVVPLERALVISYRPPTVTFPLYVRVSEISTLLCSSTPLLTTPPLVSEKFPHVPLGLSGWPLGYEERRCYAKCPCH